MYYNYGNLILVPICIIKLVKHYDANKWSHHLGVKTTKYYTQFFFMIRKRLISLEQQNTQNKHTAISKTKTMLVYISNFIIHTHDTNNKMVGKYSREKQSLWKSCHNNCHFAKLKNRFFIFSCGHSNQGFYYCIAIFPRRTDDLKQVGSRKFNWDKTVVVDRRPTDVLTTSTYTCYLNLKGLNSNPFCAKKWVCKNFTPSIFSSRFLSCDRLEIEFLKTWW